MPSEEVATNFVLGGGISLVSIGLRKAINFIAERRFASSDPNAYRRFGRTFKDQNDFNTTVDSNQEATRYFTTTGITEFIIPFVVGLAGLATCVVGAINGDLNLIALASLPTVTHGGDFILKRFAPHPNKK
ncbi:MAG: hypothetical protein US40_C0004G0001 [Candidatus Roizmanbacteria bacterium GW2011_GWC2_37_13]|uniref:Uncharacterized protein n=1 Tax=Candidatus Roizmanbacteria bacterium GW2011_GWC2_37_13 TaxID=1618486 RepID=A0A0G0JCS0_9BACT|nr:MAG: hypothetical protein US40_C0004G0001 [Candidatus Roizmanbacteria bacterium GW2011_GWC2_37_13]